MRRCVFFDCTHISIHKALASLDSATQGAGIELYISIHKALASLDLYCYRPRRKGDDISIHKALASLDTSDSNDDPGVGHFNPQGSREPRRGACARTEQDDTDFNPQGSREPRHGFAAAKDYFNDFNPQGSREPRPFSATLYFSQSRISIHKALASLDLIYPSTDMWTSISIHKALASLDLGFRGGFKYHNISIHKALASLDLLLLEVFPHILQISIHKALASLDGFSPWLSRVMYSISIHKALASLDGIPAGRFPSKEFQSTRLSRASTLQG